MNKLFQTNDVDLLRKAAILLSKENERLVQQNRLLLERIAQLNGSAIPHEQSELTFLKELLARQNQEQFGSSSEKSRHPNKETQTDQDGQQDAGKPDKKRRGHGPSEQLQLLVVDQDHPLPDDQRTCPQCHGTVEPMG
ncbi:MAG: hypothetical protein H7338_13690, partial [Candidatus Sericytochromatia bacterium]|nr:hypothetical protein [Candidatus Sericytochromatia bacterium]